ncbi:hypothetical protein LEP1GSC195_3708 [Leptospira wolbachii serovar Codice str. CDC]|uniref:Glyoxalase-like domain protein n=1 Tax=Leptospira wolbachii serovar Codice str. CDC TaxID=1218599 RepID=R9A0I5_9LEPT|nr:hypothetical protein [Leptospira wolbachii]EOQ95726.1 hypothetical protein LEP1GSC195_3708 [Leptospira wolbachii serovar Codice str. CDC]
MISKFDHFLLYSDKLEETYRFLLNHLKLVPLTPLTNYGSFQSGMFVFQNGILELLWYQKNPEEVTTIASTNHFVGFALRSDLDIQDTKLALKNFNFDSSEVIEQKVLNAKKEEVVISEILILNHFINHLQIFYIEYKNDYLPKKFDELSKTSPWEIDSFVLQVLNQKSISDQFVTLGFKKENDDTIADQNGIKIRIQESSSQNMIPSFLIKSEEGTINILKVID